MSDRSLLCSENVLPALTGVNTIGILVVVYWAGGRIGALDERVAKLEAENKALKKRLANRERELDMKMKNIIATLEEHDARLSKREKQNKTRPDRRKVAVREPEELLPPKQRQKQKPEPRRVELTEESTDSTSEEREVDSDVDFDGLYG